MKKSERSVLVVICVITFCLVAFLWWLSEQATEPESDTADVAMTEELLETGWGLIGTAVNTESEEPIPGLKIRIWNRQKVRPQDGSHDLITTTTDLEGRFRFVNLELDQLALDTDNEFHYAENLAALRPLLEKPAEPETPAAEEAAPAGENEPAPIGDSRPAATTPPAFNEVTVKFRQGGAIRGMVTDNDDAVCAGAFVLLVEVREGGPRRTWKADTDEMGTFLFERLPAGMKVELSAYFRTAAPASPQVIAVKAGELSSINLSLRPQATLLGTVRDPAGEPVPGALIVPCGPAPLHAPLFGDLPLAVRDKLKAGLVTRSGLDGGFRLSIDASGPAPGSATAGPVFLGAQVDGFLTGYSGAITFTGPGTVPGKYDISLPASAAIAGTVQNNAHKPMAGVRVAAAARTGERTIRVSGKTEANGDFLLRPLPVGASSTLTFSAPGFSEKTVDGVKTAGDPLVVILDTGGTVAGTVKSATDGQPVPAFRVLFKPLGTDTRRIMTCTGSNGAFSIDTLAAGAWDLAIAADGYRTAAVRRVTVQPGQEAPPLAVTLQKTTLISGAVQADGGKKPLAGVRVTPVLRRPDGFVEHKQGESVLTDAKGAFRLADLEPGTWLLDLSSSAPPLVWRHGPINLPAGGLIEDRKIVVGQGSGRLDVTVLGPDGKPHADALVELSVAGELSLPSGSGSCAFRTGKEGTISIPAFSTGRRTMRVALDREREPSGALVHCETRAVTIKSGETTAVTVSFAATPACRVFGTITRGGGQVKTGKVVAVPLFGAIPDRAIARKTAIDDTGNYSFAALTAGRYLFYLDGAPLERLSAKPVTVDPKAAADPAPAELRRDFDVAAGLISGNVVDKATGKSLARASVYLYYLARDKTGVTGTQAGSFITGSDGAFSFPGLKDGEYNLAALALSGAGHLEKLVLKPGSALKGLKVALAPAGTLAVTVKDEAGKPLSGVMVRAEKSGAPVITAPRQGLCLTDSAGRAVLRPLDPGDYRVVIGTPGRVSSIEPAVKLEPGKAAAVESTLNKGPQIVLTLQTPDGKPVKRCRLAVLGPGDQWVGPPVSGTLIARGELASSTGKYTLGGYAPGSFNIHILANGFKAKTAPVKIPAEGAIAPVVVKLERDR